MRRIAVLSVLCVFFLPSIGHSAEVERLVGRANYDQVKEVVLKRQIADDRLTGEALEEPIELSPCFSQAEEWAVSDAVYDLVEIAGLAVIWADTYQKVGYPEIAYQPAIRRAENALLERSKKAPLLEADDYVDFLEGQQRKVVSAVKQWRAQHNKKLPVVGSGGECGAGGPMEVNFISKPPGGQIFVISEFEYELCISRGIDPGDRQKCRFWRHAKGNKDWVSGWTYVRGEWPQGKSPPTREDFENVEPNQDISVELQ